MYYKNVGESENSYARYLFLNELLSGQDKEYIENLILRENEIPLRINTQSFYMLFTGLKKCVYAGYYGLSTNDYMEIYVKFEHKLRNYLEKLGYTGEIVLHLYADKQICVLFSADGLPKASPMSVAIYAQDYLQLLYKECFLHDNLHCNQTFFHEKPISISKCEKTCGDLMHLSNLSFFNKEPNVFTQEIMQKIKQKPDYADMQELRSAFMLAVDSGDYEMFLKVIKYIQKTVKYSFDTYLLVEVAQEFKRCYIQCCVAYDISMIDELDVYFNHTKYARVECFFQAVQSLFEVCIKSISQKDQKYSHLLQKALLVIKLGFHKPNISLTNVAEQVGVSPTYLSSIFNREMKCNMVRYIMLLRLEKACRLLENTNLKISDIALEIGYEDKKYFSKIFKDKYGLTPKEYQQSRVKSVY